MQYQASQQTFYERFVKRPLDVFFALFLMVVLFPLFLVLVCCSIIFIRGKVFFVQVRPGRAGKFSKFISSVR